MTRNIRLFIIILVISAPFWWGINILQDGVENFFYYKNLQKNPIEYSVAKIYQQKLQEEIRRKKLLEKRRENFQIEAESYLSAKINAEGKKTILLEKNSQEKRPIASLAKLITGIVAKEMLPPSQEITITKEVVEQRGINGNLQIGKEFTARQLLKIMLITSSNDAAFGLARATAKSPENFVSLMNLKAKEMELEDTHFFNPTGLDPEDSSINQEKITLSSAADLLKIMEEIIQNYPQMIEYLGKMTHKIEVSSHSYILKNTNKLLQQERVIAGKTGYTARAGECLIIVLQPKYAKKDEYIINIILGSPHRFESMEKMIDAIEK